MTAPAISGQPLGLIHDYESCPDCGVYTGDGERCLDCALAFEEELDDDCLSEESTLRSEAMKTWPVGTVIRAKCILVDWDHENRPYIKARPGELGLVWEATRGDPETFEVMFSGGCFTTIMDDSAIERYEGIVSNVVEPPDGCGHSSPTK